MILPAQAIRDADIITPFCERSRAHGMSYGLSSAGYDVRIKQELVLRAGERFKIGSTIERFVMPLDVLGIVHDKSTWARLGLSVFNTVIEPGWRGWLTLELVFHGEGMLVVPAGAPIAQVVFHRLEAVSEQIYEGKYQDQPDEPVPAILET